MSGPACQRLAGRQFLGLGLLALLVLVGLAAELHLVADVDEVPGAFDGLVERSPDVASVTVLLLGTVIRPAASGPRGGWLAGKPVLESATGPRMEHLAAVEWTALQRLAAAGGSLLVYEQGSGMPAAVVHAGDEPARALTAPSYSRARPFGDEVRVFIGRQLGLNREIPTRPLSLCALGAVFDHAPGYLPLPWPTRPAGPVITRGRCPASGHAVGTP